jgi:HEPN domain-containing protein
MKDQGDLAKGLFRKASSDLVAMEASLKAGALDACCFHAQQAVEKLLKAYLANIRTTFPYTHNLSRLVALCEQSDPSFARMTIIVEPLNPYAVDLRYDVDTWPDEESARLAQAAAETIRDFVTPRLGHLIVHESTEGGKPAAGE